MIQQAGRAPGAQGSEGKSFPPAQPQSAAKPVLNGVWHEQPRAGPAPAASIPQRDKQGYWCFSSQLLSFDSQGQGAGRAQRPQPSTSAAKMSQFTARLVNANWNRWGLTRQAANCSTWCMDVANCPFCRDAGTWHSIRRTLCLILQHPKATVHGHCCCWILHFQLPWAIDLL